MPPSSYDQHVEKAASRKCLALVIFVGRSACIVKLRTAVLEHRRFAKRMRDPDALEPFACTQLWCFETLNAQKRLFDMRAP